MEEPTVIVTFGDHQPRVESAFYHALQDGRKGESKLELAESKYRVPFIIWANYDIKSQQNIQISANYLHAYLMQQTGGAMTAYDKYLMNLRKKIPEVTEIAYMDQDDKLYENDTKYARLLDDYQKVQYNAFVDKKNRLNQYFFLRK